MAIDIKSLGSVVSTYKTLVVWCLTLPFIVHPHPDLQGKINHINHSISLFPNDTDLYLQRAELQIQHKAWNKALYDIKKAQSLQSKDHQFLYYQGLLHSALKENDLAIKSFNQYIQVADKNKAKNLIIKAKFNVGEILLKTKNYVSAAQYFHDVMTLTDQPPANIIYSTAHAYQLAGKDYFNQALIIVNQGLIIFPGFLPFLEIKIELAKKTDNHIEQMAHIQTLLNKYPNHSKWIKILNKLKASYAYDSE